MPSTATPGLAFALGSATLYGLSIGYTRLASFSGITGSTLVICRVLLVLLAAGVVAAALRHSLAVVREERVAVGLLGVFSSLIGVCYLSSVAFIPVAVAAILFYTFPVLIVLASPFVDGTRLTPVLLATVALALAGVALVVGPAADTLDLRGLALALSASVATAAQFFTATRCPKTGPTAKVFWIHLVVLPVTVAVAAAAGHMSPPSALSLAPLAVAATALGYAIGFLFQILSLERISALTAGIVYCIEPVVAALGATIILGESFGGWQWIGGAFVLTAVCTTALTRGDRASDASR
jgi:drug/metabolite transporter (DMT)-like permease